MAVTEYTYTENVNVRVLRDEINADGTISPKFVDHIVAVDDALSVWMSDVLNGGESNALDAVLAAHTNPADPTLNKAVSGSGAPDDSLGQDGDICIDPDTQEYYQKVTGSWTGPFALGGGGSVELDNQEVDSQSEFNTTSGSYVDLTTMTLTTSNTKNLNYMIFFNTELSHNGENQTIDVQIVVDGVAHTASIRSWESYDDSVNTFNPRNFSTMALVDNVANGKVIKVQVKSSTGTANFYKRSLMMRGIG